MLWLKRSPTPLTLTTKSPTCAKTSRGTTLNRWATCFTITADFCRPSLIFFSFIKYDPISNPIFTFLWSACSQGAVQKRREIERSAAEGKTESSAVAKVQQRTDVVSYALLAEMSYFHQQRVRDYNTAVKAFLQEQITYYQKVPFGCLLPYVRHLLNSLF